MFPKSFASIDHELNIYTPLGVTITILRQCVAELAESANVGFSWVSIDAVNGSGGLERSYP